MSPHFTYLLPSYFCSNAGLLEYVNVSCKQFARTELSKHELLDALTKLHRIGAIEPDPEDKSRWWLREWVRVSYRE
jgi:hypothetical protein